MKRITRLIWTILPVAAGCGFAPDSDPWPGKSVDPQAYWIARMEINATTDEGRSLESRREIFDRLEQTEDPAVVVALVDSLDDQRICDPEAGLFSAELPGQTYPCPVGSRCHSALLTIFGFMDLGVKPGGPSTSWREWLDDRSGMSIEEIYDQVTADVRFWQGWPPAKSAPGAR